MSDRISITLDEGVADVRFTRPEKINALDRTQFEAIVTTIARLESMKGVRCVVLSGEGRGFCGGIDLEALSAGADAMLGDLMPRTHGDANLFQQAAWGWRTLSVPVIAAVHGFALGGGFQIMLGADIRIAAPDAQLSMMEARWGLVPDMGGFPLLRGLVRDDIAREITYTARRFSGEEAASLGIVTRTAADPLAEALDLARTIAGHSPAAIRAGKRLFNLSADADIARILTAESEEQKALLASAGHAETIAASAQGRKPVFQD